jgi:outer membrane lipoprotein-sorting protein
MRKTFILLLLSFSFTCLAESPEEKGLAIAVEADKRDTGWVDSTNDLQMILRNAQGQESKRAIRLKTLEIMDDGDKSMSIFDTPRDVKGTAFVSYTHAITPDDQWLYLPALKRIKRISSANKSGPFMGSEFAYEDISSQEIEKYTYKWLRNEILNGKNVFVIERYPVYKHSGYKRMIAWIDKEIYMPLKIEFYDRKDALLKTLTVHDYKQYLEQYWRPDRQEMINHQSKKNTTLLWSNYQFKTGLTNRNFDKNSLKRAR